MLIDLKVTPILLITSEYFSLMTAFNGQLGAIFIRIFHHVVINYTLFQSNIKRHLISNNYIILYKFFQRSNIIIDILTKESWIVYFFFFNNLKKEIFRSILFRFHSAFISRRYTTSLSNRIEPCAKHEAVSAPRIDLFALSTDIGGDCRDRGQCSWSTVYSLSAVLSNSKLSIAVPARMLRPM